MTNYPAITPKTVKSAIPGPHPKVPIAKLRVSTDVT